MSGLINALVIVAVVVLVIGRQFRASPVDADRRWWVLPEVLAVMALREPGLLDARHHTASVRSPGASPVRGPAYGERVARPAWKERL
ncbi:hypothetical protein ACFY30_29405 [Streptomyces sp. NPDC000345]|uniref:hypothetical protein n=1 Tax=Streptomyces sp. NPDC000345 TaxID=3364537 RepID=UPI003677ADCF